MTDKLRVLAALQQGTVSPIDFAAPNVIDGGKPVMRVAARVKELRDAGYTIRSSRAANGIALYRLDAEPENSDASPQGLPEMAAPSVVAVQQAPVDAVAPPAAVVTPPSRDHAGDLLDGALFDGDEFRDTNPHWRAA